MGKLRRIAKTAILPIEVLQYFVYRIVENGTLDLACGFGFHRLIKSLEVVGQFFGTRPHLLLLLSPRLPHTGQYPPERGHSVQIFGRKVCTAKKWFQFRSQKHGHWPATVA